MNLKKRNHLILLIFFPVIFLGWQITERINNELSQWGWLLIPTSAGALSLYWLWKTCRDSATLKGYWRWVMAAVFFNTLGNAFWALMAMHPFPEGLLSIFDLFLVLSYFMFLCGLVTRIMGAGVSLSNKDYLFNIAVYMIMAFSISYHFLVEPFLSLPGFSFFDQLSTLAVHLTDLAILFFCLILYYLIRLSFVEKTAWFLLVGLFLQLTADMFLMTSFTHVPESVLEFLWMLSPLVIGLTGLMHNPEAEKRNGQALMLLTEKNEGYLPYACCLIMMVVVTESYEWKLNMLSGGSTLIILLIIGKQLLVTRQNRTLMNDLKHLAFRDQLTGLKNRYSLMKEIDQSLKKGNRPTLFLFDLDRFKNINDSLGHQAGDEILSAVASRVQSLLIKEEQLYRLGGDEFVLLLEDVDQEEATCYAQALLDIFYKEFLVGNRRFFLGTSIGISRFGVDAWTAEDLLKYADMAMYQVKATGKNHYFFYDVSLNQEMSRKVEVENELNRAVIENQFFLVYQPKLEVSTNEIYGVEALIRWQHPRLGVVSPLEFIPIAEETGLIIDIGAWVLEESCKQVKAWQGEGLRISNLSVNVSVLQMKHENFLEVVQTALHNSKLHADVLELEITETLMQETSYMIDILSQVKHLGVKTSIDDFGTGYSSLHVLQRLPVDTLKIDRSFIQQIEESNDSPMVKTIIELSKNLGLSVVAEGVETKSQLHYLHQLGCDFVQGYLIAKPLRPLELKKHIQQPNSAFSNTHE